MFKKFLDTNREDILIKGAMLGGVTAGLIGGTVVDRLRKPKMNVVIVGEVVTEPTEPEAPKAEEQ